MLFVSKGEFKPSVSLDSSIDAIVDTWKEYIGSTKIKWDPYSIQALTLDIWCEYSLKRERPGTWLTDYPNIEQSQLFVNLKSNKIMNDNVPDNQ